MAILTLIFFLIVASVCACIAEALVPGEIPGGFLATAIVGMIGAWMGSSLVGAVGPTLAGVPLVSTILGSALLVLGFTLIRRAIPRRL